MMAMALLMALALQDDAAAAKESIDTFKTAYAKSKDAKARAEAVAELAKTQHDSVAVKLGSLLTTDHKDVRIAAATGLGTFNKTAELKGAAAKQLGQALSSGANAREVDVRVAIFAALGSLQEESSCNVVKSHFEDRDSKIACAAVSAAGAIRSKTLIEPLIAVMRQCEQTLKSPSAPPSGPAPLTGTGLPIKGGKAPPNPQGPTPNPKDVDKETKDRANAVLSAAESALNSITKQDGLRTSDDWERWWIKNRATFTVPK